MGKGTNCNGSCRVCPVLQTWANPIAPFIFSALLKIFTCFIQKGREILPPIFKCLYVCVCIIFSLIILVTFSCFLPLKKQMVVIARPLFKLCINLSLMFAFWIITQLNLIKMQYAHPSIYTLCSIPISQSFPFLKQTHPGIWSKYTFNMLI